MLERALFLLVEVQLMIGRGGVDEVGALVGAVVGVDILRGEEISLLILLAAFRVSVAQGLVVHGLAVWPLHAYKHCSWENGDRRKQVQGKAGLLGRIRHCCCTDASLDLVNPMGVSVEQLEEPRKSAWDQPWRMDMLRQMPSVVRGAQETLSAGHGFSGHADRSRYSHALLGFA